VENTPNDEEMQVRMESGLGLKSQLRPAKYKYGNQKGEVDENAHTSLTIQILQPSIPQKDKDNRRKDGYSHNHRAPPGEAAKDSNAAHDETSGCQN